MDPRDSQFNRSRYDPSFPPPPPPPHRHFSDLENRRYRMREDVILDEDFRDRAQVNRVRTREDGILEGDFDPRIPVPIAYQNVNDLKLNAGEIAFQEARYANKGSDEGFTNSEVRFQGNQGFQENHYQGKRKWVHEDDDGFQEKRRNFNGGSSHNGNDWNFSKRPGQKTSALGRIRSGISVWSRIEEKPPSPSLPTDDFSRLGVLEENQPEVERLDLSYKSNALVAKVVVPSSPDQQPNNDEESPRVVIPQDRMKTRKVGIHREQVVIPIVSHSVVSKKPVSSSFQVSSATTKIVKDSSNDGGSPRVVIPKDRMKMKKVGSDREQVVVPIVSSFVDSKKPISSSFQGSNSKKPVSSSCQGSNATTKIVKYSSRKPVNDRSRKESGTLSKASGDGSEPACDGSKKPIRSNKPSLSKTASDGPKKAISSSPKLVGNSGSRPLSKKIMKVTSAKKASVKRAVNPIEKNIQEDIRHAGMISKPTNHSGPRPFETASVDNSALENKGKDADFVYWPMEVVPLIENRTTEQSINIGMSTYGKMVVMTPTKEINLDQRTMASENIAVEQDPKEMDFCQALTVETTASEKNPMEHHGKIFDAVQEPVVASSSADNNAAEQSNKNVTLVRDNVVKDTVKKETITLFEEVDRDFTSSTLSNTRTVIDISSDSSDSSDSWESSDSWISSSEEVTISRSPCNANAENSNKEGAIGNPSEELGMPFKESSLFGLVGDAQVQQHVTVSVDTVISPSFCGILKDDDGKRDIKQIDAQHTVDAPSIGEEVEISGKPIKESWCLSAPSDASNLVQELKPHNSMTDKEDENLLLPSRGLPVPESAPILEDCLMDATMTARMEQLLPSNSSKIGTLSEISQACALSSMMEKHSDSQQSFVSQYHNNTGITNEQDEKTTKKVHSLASKQSAFDTEMESKSGNTTMQCHHPASVKTQLLQSYEPKKQLNTDAKPMKPVSISTKSILSSETPRVSNQLSSSGSLKETARPNLNARNKTWHRTDSPSFVVPLHGNLRSTGGIYKQLAKKQSMKKLGRVANASYVRKGNSLIRKPVNVVPPPILPYGFDASSKKSQLTEKSMTLGSVDNTSNVKTYSNLCLERPKTPPLCSGPKFPSCTLDTQKDFPLPMSEDPVSAPSMVAQAKPAEDLSVGVLSGNVDDHSMAATLSRKRMIYVKHKSNQLVAAPTSGDSSTCLTEKADKVSSSTPSDLYYMRKKNQLILNALSSSDSQHKQDKVTPSNSDDHGAADVFFQKGSRRSPFKKRLDKALRKTYKHSKFSRVWTLGGRQSSEKGSTSQSSLKVMPCIFPWKRTTYNRFSNNKVAMNCNRGSLSLVSRKLQLMRKRDTIYTVSTDGFSLRKAGVVSIGGASLKWSKSIERHSKKANEEATLAVAEAERKNRERKQKRSISSRAKNGHNFRRKATHGIDLQQGERIYRVGSVRYKMDASKRTLIRVPDEQSLDGVGQQTEKNVFVPRRLLIGNDEYIRIGSGNKLVRDPKKLIRMLASEKIRWSLHTTRLRLAKKHQYCQFFTRFGKCNKNSGKCPYIHDPGKVAICTKFLRGVCTDVNCKLTHEVIPERMPDCSYFLLGLCTNESCPYRHVYVNPKASVCDGFLRGYCADGDECRKKHSYVCPEFEATGKCPQGSKCKLHHPKSRNKSQKKRKHCQSQSNSRGRYFRSKIITVSEPLAVVSEKRVVDKDADPFCCDGQFADFISIDGYSDDDGMEIDHPKDLSTKEGDSDDSRADELDALIKPVRIMNEAGLPDAFLTC